MYLFVYVGKVAGVTGLEPAASGVTGQRSNQLSYTPAFRFAPAPCGRRPFTKSPRRCQAGAAMISKEY